MTEPRVDTVVVGAGIVGLACAERLTAAGLRVTLVERACLGGGSTGVSGGLVRIFELDDRVRELAEESFDVLCRRGWRGRWPRVRDVGSLTIVPPMQDDAAAQIVASLRGRRHEIDFHGHAEIRRRYPWAAAMPTHTAGVWEPRAGWVPAAMLARRIAADANGLNLREGVAATRVLRRHDTVVGVATSAGDIPTSTVVLAAGTASAGLAGVELPLRTRAVGWARFETPSEFVGSPTVVDHDCRIWFRPSEGTILAGAVDDTLDVAATVTDGVSAVEERRLRDALAVRYPPLAHARLIDGVTAYDAVSPERRGAVRCWDSPRGLVTATGWNGGGIKQAPAIGVRAASLVLRALGGAPHSGGDVPGDGTCLIPG